MSDKIAVNIALEDYFAYLTSQVSAGNQLKNAVNDLLARKDNSDFGNTGKTKIDEWDVLDQSYISIKLQNAFTEIESKADALQDNVTNLRKGETKRNLSLPETSTEEVLSLVLSIITELYQYHKAVADCLAPLVEYSVYRERYPTKYEMKECSSVPVTWKAVSEVNRSLRYGYGLNKEDLASILSWKHGEDLSESARKNLNQRVDSLVQTYKERLGNLDTCEVDVPIAFQLYPLVLQDILKDCCSPVESIAAVGQVVPSRKEELDTLILREIPKIQLQIGDTVYEVASPGKAFENTKQKMYAVRHLVSKAYKSQKIQINKEQLDLCSLKVLATACISIANASSRTAVVMAFGKANLIQVKPSPSKIEDPPAQITLDSGCILIEVPSQWSLVEDSELLSSLSRDMNSSFPIATVDTIYRGSLDVKAELEKRAQSLPVVRIQRCSGMLNSKAADKKDQSSRGIRKRLSRATQKLFNRKSLSGMPQKTPAKQGDGQDYIDASSGIVNPAAIVRDGEDDAASKSGAENSTPVPPPRPRRKARKKKKSESSRRHQREIEEAKRDPQWFSSCRKLQAPETTESKAPINSLSVASFEELRDVIDFLSGSSTSSLCLSQPMDSDKTSLRKAVTSKEVQAAVVIDDKGKVSPSDSGIGSTMSVRSHPSIGSITGLSGHERVAKLDGGRSKMGESANRSRIVINEEGKLELESEESDDEQQDHKVVSLHSKLDFETHKNSLVEDAEVERYIRKSSSCLKLAEERKTENEDACKTPTMTRTSSTSSDSDNEASVQDVIDDLKASLEFQKGNIDTTSPRTGSEIMVQKEDKFLVEGENLEVDNDSEAAVVSDHLSYDADGSEESEESNPLIDQAKSRSSTTLHGSTESLYYSAWTLNEPKTEGEDNLEDQSKADEQTDSFFTSGLKETSLTESLDGTEEFQDCEQPTEMLYGNFNTRFSWPDEFGEHFAAIWGGKDTGETETSPPVPKGGVWSPGASLAPDKRFQPHSHQEGTRYNQVHPTMHFNTLQVNPSLDWKQRKPEDVGAAQTHEEQWSSVSSPTLKRQHEFQDHHSDWKLRNAQHAGTDRRSTLHASITRGGFASAPHVTQPQMASGGWASAGHMNRSSGLSIQHGPSFGRPSSVPAQISRPFVPPSTRAYNQAGFDFETSAAARHAASPLFNNSSSSNSTGLAQYQNWSRESGSDPVLGGSNKRQISEYEALALQQTQARNQMISRRLQQGQNQPHWS